MNFGTGLVVGVVFTAVVAGSKEPKVVEVLPDNYAIVTSTSDTMCTGPTGKTNIVHTRTRTQTVAVN
jgi:hypothetical protein